MEVIDLLIVMGPQFRNMSLGENHAKKKKIREIGVPVEIQTIHFCNTIRKCFRFSDKLHHCCDRLCHCSYNSSVTHLD